MGTIGVSRFWSSSGMSYETTTTTQSFVLKYGLKIVWFYTSVFDISSISDIFLLTMTI